MNKILAKRTISDIAVRFEISTSIAVKDIKPGHYIVIKVDRNDPGVSLPVVKTNISQATVTVIVLISNNDSRKLAALDAGSSDFEIEGPFGYPLLIEHFGTVLCIGRGSGILPLLPVITALQAVGNQVISVLSAPTKEDLVLQNEITATSDKVKLLTDDGSCAENGSLSVVLEQALRNHFVNQVMVMGPALTIRETFSLTAKYKVPTQAGLYRSRQIQDQLHGIFRVSICGDVRSVCLDGYNFNAWYPNFEEMLKRFGEIELDGKKKVNQLNELKVLV